MMKSIALLAMLLAGWIATVRADSPGVAPRGKVSYSLRIPQEQARQIQPDQRVDIYAGSAPLVRGAMVLLIGRHVLRDGSVIIVLAMDPPDEEKLQIAEGQKPPLSIVTTPKKH